MEQVQRLEQIDRRQGGALPRGALLRREDGNAASFRRAFNVAIAVVALVLTLPLWLLIALAIKLDSSGPVFYTQERVGLDRRRRGVARDSLRRRSDLGGRPFKIYKFRTMTVDAEKATGAVWSRDGDPRVTLVGRVLRTSRLDELPQLINVIKGEMSVVGPRPERPSIFAKLRQEIPEYPLRQRALPGITGHAQINLEPDSCVEDVIAKLRYDLEYIGMQSLLVDLLIIVKTLPVMLFRRHILRRAA
jgi:lipopolysaccharide/colanic/teichoic acid biosynthesis glycosyltransferase